MGVRTHGKQLSSQLPVSPEDIRMGIGKAETVLQPSAVYLQGDAPVDHLAESEAVGGAATSTGAYSNRRWIYPMPGYCLSGRALPRQRKATAW